MHKQQGVASWFLHILLPATHADSVLGDLLELAADDQARFRSLVLVTVWSLLARRLTGFLLAAVVGGGGMVAMQSVFFKSLATHAATHSQQAWGSTLVALAGCLLIMWCFSIVSYGLRDRMSQLASAYIPALATAALFWWVPWVPATAEMVLLALLVGGLLWRDSRNALLAVATLLGVQFLLWFGGIGLLLAPLAMLWRHAPGNALVLKSLALTGFAASYMFLMLLMCLTYAKVRRRVFA